MCSSPHWQVGLSWFREKLSPANREQRLSRWADFAKNCLPRIGSKELPRFREKYRALGRQKNGVQHATAIYPIPRYTRPRYIGLTLYCSLSLSHRHVVVISSVWYRSDFKLTKGTPYLAFAGELWCVFVSILEKNYPFIKRFNCVVKREILSKVEESWVWRMCNRNVQHFKRFTKIDWSN